MLYLQAGDQEIVTPEIAIVPGQWIFVAAVARARRRACLSTANAWHKWAR